MATCVCFANLAHATRYGNELPALPDVGFTIVDASVLNGPVTVTEPAVVQYLLRPARSDVAITQPDWSALMPDELELLDATLSESNEDSFAPQGRTLHITLTIDALAPGVYEIEPAEFVATSAAEPDWSYTTTAEPISITVESILNEGDTTLADIKDPIDPPPDYLRIGAYVAGGVLAAALLAAGIAVIARRRPDVVPEPPVPAHVTAINEIDALLAADLIERKRWKAYFGELSGILRRYIEGRFDLHAPTQTTEEFLRDPRMTNMFEAQHDAHVRGLLGQADMVKFAEGAMDAKGARGAAERVRAFVEETGVHSAHEPEPREEAAP